MTRHDLVLTPSGLRFGGRLYPCSVGRGGIRGDKREGDGATPKGCHAITGILYRPDRIARPHPMARPIRPGDLWSDDPGQPDYNLMVPAPCAHSHERLRRADRLYDLVLLTDWNTAPVVPGRGSAIFLHRWRKPGHPTEGCVALHPVHLRAIARAITGRTRLIVP